MGDSHLLAIYGALVSGTLLKKDAFRFLQAVLLFMFMSRNCGDDLFIVSLVTVATSSACRKAQLRAQKTSVLSRLVWRSSPILPLVKQLQQKKLIKEDKKGSEIKAAEIKWLCYAQYACRLDVRKMYIELLRRDRPSM